MASDRPQRRPRRPRAGPSRRLLSGSTPGASRTPPPRTSPTRATISGGSCTLAGFTPRLSTRPSSSPSSSSASASRTRRTGRRRARAISARPTSPAPPSGSGASRTSSGPGVIAFVGKEAYRGAFGERPEHGLQAARLGGHRASSSFPRPRPRTPRSRGTSGCAGSQELRAHRRWPLTACVPPRGRSSSTPADRVLLVRFAFPWVDQALVGAAGRWARAGREPPSTGLRRELAEEVGLVDPPRSVPDRVAPGGAVGAGVTGWGRTTGSARRVFLVRRAGLRAGAGSSTRTKLRRGARDAAMRTGDGSRGRSRPSRARRCGDRAARPGCLELARARLLPADGSSGWSRRTDTEILRSGPAHQTMP